MRKIILPPIVLGLCLMAMGLVNYYDLAKTIFVSNPLNYFGFLFISSGLFLPVWGAHLFKKHQTNILPYKNPDNIVKSGPFSFSRNPLYLGMLLGLIGFAIYFGTVESFIFPVILFCVINWYHIPFEEEKMTEAFGDEFINYKAKVRRWI